jgi:hypothetical protein
MKRLSFFFIVVFVSLSINTYGQNSYIGRINSTYAPPFHALEVGCNMYVLTLDGSPVWSGDPLIVDGLEYFFGDIVGITGYLKPVADYFELEIEAIEKWSLNQNVQRFLGEYLLECECIDQIHMEDTLFYECAITIKEGAGIESDLLIDIEAPVEYKDLKTFTFNNAFFIPWQENEERASFRGGGEIKNDSLFIRFATTISYRWVVCNCKGEKTGSGIISPPKLENKVYYDATNQTIVIDEALQNQSLTLELYDIQGKVILRKTDVGNTISAVHLPAGMYLYRLLENSRTIYSGKILKK